MTWSEALVVGLLCGVIPWVGASTALSAQYKTAVCPRSVGENSVCVRTSEFSSWSTNWCKRYSRGRTEVVGGIPGIHMRWLISTRGPAAKGAKHTWGGRTPLEKSRKDRNLVCITIWHKTNACAMGGCRRWSLSDLLRYPAPLP